jgi:hypothetical protein
VGWSQLSDAFLNVGFDRNRKPTGKNFFNIYNEWEPSIYEGALMIRPIFTRTAADFPDDCEEIEPPVEADEKNIEYIVYPNPVSDGILYMSKDDYYRSPIKAQRIKIYDATGRLALNTATTDGKIDISMLPNGIYILHVEDDNKYTGSKRILITK